VGTKIPAENARRPNQREPNAKSLRARRSCGTKARCVKPPFQRIPLAEGQRPLRHTHGSHALNGRPGGKGVPAASGTTSGYLTTARDARLAAMKGFDEKDDRRR